ncbi:hypothetical protein JZ751_029348 [Albula glossodonta]|uniref:Uncharacterized protein n=1 Tax=Albula glossodonta TaxID=121402 RepID=A0A8T2PAP0_9TELE|nr:hypothetical protein JZ751_029348 [Albula glossodonta]
MVLDYIINDSPTVIFPCAVASSLLEREDMVIGCQFQNHRPDFGEERFIKSRDRIDQASPPQMCFAEADLNPALQRHLCTPEANHQCHPTMEISD